jgi:hypothetical protein
MPNLEDINHQKAQLEIYRKNLRHLLTQAAKYGGEDAAPLIIMNDIDGARDNIRRIKATLSRNNVSFEDNPEDTPHYSIQNAEQISQSLAQHFKSAYTILRRETPQNTNELDHLLYILHVLGRFHEKLNEWKELHNLLQECITDLTPLKDAIDEVIVRKTDTWERSIGVRLWYRCRTRLHQLEKFAQDIRHIDKSFYRSEGILYGPSWMISIASLRANLEICLKEDDTEEIYDATMNLWDECYTALYQADKRLRDMVGELHAISKAILRSVEDDDSSR